LKTIILKKNENKDTKPQVKPKKVEDHNTQKSENKDTKQKKQDQNTQKNENKDEKNIQRQDPQPKIQQSKQQNEDQNTPKNENRDTKTQVNTKQDPYDIPFWFIRDQKGNEIGSFTSREMESQLQKGHLKIEHELRRENENFTKLGDLIIKENRNPFTLISLNEVEFPSQFKESLIIYYESKKKKDQPEPIYGPVIGSSLNPPPQINRISQETVDPMKFLPMQPGYKGNTIYQNLQQLQQHQIKMRQLYQTLMNQHDYPNKLELNDEGQKKFK